MSKKKVLIGLMVVVLPIIAGAQALPPPPATTIGGVINIFCGILGWAFTILFLLAVVFVLVAAFYYLTSSGEPEKIKTANKTLLYAAVAVAIALLSRGVPFIVSNLVRGNAGGDPCSSGASAPGPYFPSPGPLTPPGTINV